MQKNPNISIITNFGCNSNCWYCIWKDHKLNVLPNETDWDLLSHFLYDHWNSNRVSISGGGDPLYRYDDNKKWWDFLFSITSRLKLKVSVHTKEFFYLATFWDNVDRVSFSSDRMNQDEKLYLRYLSSITKVRIVHVVTEDTTDEVVEEYLEMQKDINCQLTFKELVGFDDKGRYKELKAKYPHNFYLDHGDYNLYYMPDNTITETFL